MSAISPSTSSKTTKELSTPDLNVKNKIELKDGLIPTRKNSEETSSTSPSDNVEFTNSPVPLTPKENSTNQQTFGPFNNSSGNSISGQNVESISSPNVNVLSSPGQQQNSIVSNNSTEFSYFKIGFSEDRNKRCRRTMEVNYILR